MVLAMATGSNLEWYFPRLLGEGGGCGSSSSAEAASSIASSAINIDTKKRALHSVCPASKKQKFPQPRGNLQRRSNPTVKLFTPLVHV
jgi:hypothetical protein